MSRNGKLVNVTVKLHSIQPFHIKEFNDITLKSVKERFTENGGNKETLYLVKP